MTTSIERTSRPGKPRLSEQLKASDLFPPGHGWNTEGTFRGTGNESSRQDARDGAEQATAPRQH